MRKFSILAAAAAALISTVGMAAEPQTFTRDGHTYVYTTTARTDGKTLIEGREAGSHNHFRLLVTGDRVTGQTNGYPVSFRASEATATQVAAN